MDEFAQSREDNDLFADDFEPAGQELIIEEAAAIGPEYKPRKGGRHGSNGGRPNRRSELKEQNGQDGRGLRTSQFADNSQRGEIKGKEKAEAEPNDPANIHEPSLPTQPAQPVYRGPRSVRGDRSATGGPAHTKLTEDELSEKMAKMEIINAEKAEKFRLSEADSAAFAQKENEIRRKRVEEQKNSRAMDMERAKNRERKMKAQGGREWDSEKLEADIVDGQIRGRSSEYVRGGFGGVIRGREIGLASSRFGGNETYRESDHIYRESPRGRGYGNRGAQRERGGNGQMAPLGPEEFPSLPPSKTKATSARPNLATTQSSARSSNTAAPVNGSGAFHSSNSGQAAKSITRPSATPATSNWADEVALATGAT